MPKIDHYENLDMFLSKALSKGIDNKHTARMVRREATNMYVNAQLKNHGKRIVTLYQTALGETKLPATIWKKLARVNKIALDLKP